MRDDLAQNPQLPLGQHQIAPRRLRLDPSAQLVHAHPGLGEPGTPGQTGRVHLVLAGQVPYDRRSGGLDQMRRQRELRDEIPQIVLAHLRYVRERVGPHTQLLLRVQRRHGHPLAAWPGGLPGIGTGDDERNGRALDERVRGRRLVAVELADLDEQRGGQHDGLALPQPCQPVALDRIGGHVVGGHGVQTEPRTARRRRGDVGTGPQIAADEFDPERRMRPGTRPACGDLARSQVVRGGQRLRYGRTAQQSVQPGVQIGRADEEVQDALVEAQP